MASIFDFFMNMFSAIPSMWDWLITPLEIAGLNIAPLYLMVGVGALIVGVIRAIV